MPLQGVQSSIIRGNRNQWYTVNIASAGFFLPPGGSRAAAPPSDSSSITTASFYKLNVLICPQTHALTNSMLRWRNIMLVSKTWKLENIFEDFLKKKFCNGFISYEIVVYLLPFEIVFQNRFRVPIQESYILQFSATFIWRNPKLFICKASFATKIKFDKLLRNCKVKNTKPICSKTENLNKLWNQNLLNIAIRGSRCFNTSETGFDHGTSLPSIKVYCSLTTIQFI